MNYYKKTSFTGWVGGMRFLIRRETPELPASADAAIGEPPQTSDPVFRVYAWPGPYIFDKTPDNQKIDATFPFTEEGRRACVDWLNQQYDQNPDRWPKQKVAGVWKTGPSDSSL